MVKKNLYSLDQKALIEVKVPAHQNACLVISSPHSGRNYNPKFLSSSRLDCLAIRRSEDPYVDKIFRNVINMGIPAIYALFPRAFVDPNRGLRELDPKMFKGRIPNIDFSSRAAAGFGVIPRCVASGERIYSKPLPAIEATRRIDAHYKPYHNRLSSLIEKTLLKFGQCLLLDCHSMPSSTFGFKDINKSNKKDIILGNRFGKTCAPEILEAAKTILIDLGFSVAVNDPYAGAYIISHYGKPQNKVHALQLEINRELYLNEKTFTPLPALDTVSTKMLCLVKKLGQAIT